jgi:SRSO17 transposase
VTRGRRTDKSFKYDYDLSFAPEEAAAAAFARVTEAAHKIEECFWQAKGQAGLGDDQVRNRMGWHHHQTLSRIASWFLARKPGGGKRRPP